MKPAADDGNILAHLTRDEIYLYGCGSPFVSAKPPHNAAAVPTAKPAALGNGYLVLKTEILGTDRVPRILRERQFCRTEPSALQPPPETLCFAGVANSERTDNLFADCVTHA